MKLHTFKGGIFPNEMKELSNSCEIADVFPSSKTVTIPVTMGGAPNAPLVKVGDIVARGQKIADSDKFMSTPVHSSVAGKVKKIQNFMVPGCMELPCIVIESDGTNREEFMSPLDPFSCSKEDAIKRVREAGIVGMGGAAFPTHVKLNVPEGKKVSYVLLNAAECEPYLTIDERTLQENTAKVIEGLASVCRVAGAKGIISIENNKEYIIPLLTEEINKQGFSNIISIALLKTKYPQGCEKNMVDSVLGVEVPAGKLPLDSGAMIINVGTVCAVSDAFRLGKPLIDRPLTISGGACAKPRNIRIPVGTVIEDLIPEFIELKESEVAKIIIGGPMMGFTMPNTQFPVTKGTNGVTFLTKKETYITEETQCIGCGHCVDVCPMRLTPVMITRSLKADDIKAAKKFGLLDCIECGCCAFICPANERLVQKIRLGKQKLRILAAEEKEKKDSANAAGGAK